MKRIILSAAVAFTGLFAVANAPQAANSHVDANCNLTIPRDNMTNRDAHDVYLCLADTLSRGYLTGDKRWIPREFVQDFRTWTPASTLPADPGTHSGRFLFTYVNQVGAAQYTKYQESNFTMPVGSVIAKESFSVTKKGKAKPGPLFIMQKAAAGASPKTNDWYYMMVSPKGKPLSVNVFRACNDCHEGFADSDYMGYPEEEVRRRF